MKRIYLDHNGTSPVRPEAAAAVARALIRGGNPSSLHAEGRKARALLEESREAVASLVGAKARNVTVTSGATEALNTVLTSCIRFGTDERPWRLFMAAAEHPAVLNGHRFSPDSVEVVPVDAQGVIDLSALEAAMKARSDERPLVALQLANNETGVIQPVAEAARLVKAAGGALVCDAVQAAGKIAVDLAALGADALVLSGHKLGAPSGVGAIVRASEAFHIEHGLVRGGGQEKGLRGGTENLAGSAGFAAAAKAAGADLESEGARLLSLRERFEAGLKQYFSDAILFGEQAERLPNTTCFALPGVTSETALIALDLAGFAISSGSACSSGKAKRSHVLEAMGFAPDIAGCALRASFGWTTVESDIDEFLEALTRLRANSPAAGKVLAA